MRAIGSVLVGFFLVALVGCTGPKGEEPPESRGTLSTASVSAPGLNAMEASTAAALPLLQGFDDQQVFALSSKNSARLYAPLPTDELETALGDTEARLADGITAPEIQETDGAAPSDRIEVKLDQIEMRKLSVRFERVEETLTAFLKDADEVDPDALKKLEVGQAAAGPVLLEHVAEVAADSPANRVTWDSVAVITGDTMDEVRFRMERLAGSLGEAEVTTIPQPKEQLEVRLTREAILNQVVHFPEVQEALLPYADRKRTVGESAPAVVLMQTPLPYEQASKAIVTSNRSGDDLPLTMVAEVSVVDRPEAIVRLPGNDFVGFVLVKGLPASELAWQAWQSATRPSLVENWDRLPIAVRALIQDVLMARR